MNKTGRKNSIDMLKGIAIIAVVLYHMGLLESGYLGVDVFFVIAGFFTVSSINNKLENNSFSVVAYIKNKIIRLLPSVLIVSLICLIIGFPFWLPDNYENLSENVIASVFFSNNILSAITTGNYWNTLNDYNPLMHMWYLGILAEFYVIAPFITKAFRYIAAKAGKNTKNAVGIGYCSLCLLSLTLFLLPQFSAGEKFYYLPFRFFELGIGAVVGIYYEDIRKQERIKKKPLFWGSLCLLVFTLCIGLFNFDINSIGVEKVIIGGSKVTDNGLILSNTVLILISVILTAILLATAEDAVRIGKDNALCIIGKRSFSIFVWHQVLLALYRYLFSSKITVLFIIGYTIAVVVVSEINYRLTEQRIKETKPALIATVISALVICGASGVIYLKAGVVRDIPELGITTEDVHRNMHAEYCDRIYKFDKEFEENGKTNVLVIGNSFARDLGNIIIESGYDVNLSYIYSLNDTYIGRIKKADIVFIFSAKENVPDYVFENCTRVYGIGTKKFGSTNGNIYSRRFFKDYYSQNAELDEGYRKLNEEWKAAWGEYYIDMIEPVALPEGRIRVFSDENMFISQDCSHLTQAGAVYYAKLLDLEKYLTIES